MKSPKAPEAPDPVQTAQAQSAANKEAVYESARVNQMREVTPYGTVRYEGDIGSPDRTKIMELSPEQQRQFDIQNQLAETLGGVALGRAGGITNDSFNPDFSADAQKVEQATYDRAMGLMRPDFERDQRRLETKLANQGLPLGSEAYNDEMTRFDRARDEARQAAALQAVGAGRGEQSRLFGLEQAKRNQQINELSALVQGRGAIDGGGFGQSAQYQMAAPDVMGAYNSQYGGAMNAYNQKVATNNANTGAGAAVAAAAVMAF